MLDRVPYEIFRDIIFSSLRFSFIFGERSRPPIKATHVCRAWRTALLSDPTMWTCITLTDRIEMHMDGLRETISRSGPAPLDVLVAQCHGLFEPCLVKLNNIFSVISQEMYRCRELKIIIVTQLVPSVSYCLSRPVPMLQKFYFEVVGDENGSETRDAIKGIHENLFSGDAPNLEHVRLIIFSRLNDLRLSFNNLSSLSFHFFLNTFIDGDTLLDILQLSPRLRILDTFWSLSGQEAVLSTPSNRRISLPYLQKLSLQGNCGVDIVDLVLGHLDFPVKVKFDINCEDAHPRISESTAILHFLGQRRLTALKIYFDPFLMTVDLSESMESFTDALFQTVFIHSSAPSDHLPNYLRIFKLSDITNIYLDGIPLDSVILRSILVLLQNLQYMCICHGPPDEGPPLPGSSFLKPYLTALMPQPQHLNPQMQTSSESETDDAAGPVSNIGADQGHLVPCPSLDTIKLLFVCDDVKLDEAYFEALARCSRIRGQAGYPFKYVVNCRGKNGLAEEFDAWLQVHEGFPIEVQSTE